MPIRVQIVTDKWNPISMCIRFFTRHWASHCEFIDTERNVTLGARAIGGVKFRDASKDRYSIVEQFTAEGIKEAYEWASLQVGKKYDFKAIFGILLDQDLEDLDRFDCSKLLHLSFIKSSDPRPLLSTRPSAQPARITPRDLLLSRSLDYIA